MRKLALCLAALLLAPGTSFGQGQLKAKLIMCSMPSQDLAKSRAFYGALLGSDAWARALTDQVEAYHQVISSDGIDLNLTQRQSPNETGTCFYSVDDLNQATAALTAAGGAVVRGPFELPIAKDAMADYAAEVQTFDPGTTITPSAGQCTIMRDPDGNMLGLMQLAPHTQKHFKAGKFKKGLDKDQIDEQAKAIKVAKKHYKS
jgi:predicted enzyme related to lactoylglutathione lyase